MKAEGRIDPLNHAVKPCVHTRDKHSVIVVSSLSVLHRTMPWPAHYGSS